MLEMARRVVGFPDPVNELAARSVAACVTVVTLATVVLGLAVGSGWLWVSAALCYGFLARVVTGPTLSPFGQLATRVLAPRLGPARPVPGPPKRFAQLLGLAFTATATVLVATGHPAGAAAVLCLVIVAATLESAFGFCIGCRIFAVLMRAGLIPADVCEACADISRRQVAAPPA